MIEILSIECTQSGFDRWPDSDDALLDVRSEDRNPNATLLSHPRPAHRGCAPGMRSVIKFNSILDRNLLAFFRSSFHAVKGSLRTAAMAIGRPAYYAIVKNLIVIAF
jgi:hypothetical protein